MTPASWLSHQGGIVFVTPKQLIARTAKLVQNVYQDVPTSQGGRCVERVCIASLDSSRFSAERDDVMEVCSMLDPGEDSQDFGVTFPTKPCRSSAPRSCRASRCRTPRDGALTDAGTLS